VSALVLVLGGDREPLAARHEHAQLRGLREHVGDCRCRREQLLKIVEQEQRPLAAQVVGQAVVSAHDLRDRRFDQIGFAQSSQGDPPDAVLELLDELGRRLQGEPRLAGTAGAGQSHEARGREQLEHLGELPLSPDKRRRLHGQIRLVERLQGREMALAGLVERLRLGQVFEPV
jgi:hypothetical protein